MALVKMFTPHQQRGTSFFETQMGKSKTVAFSHIQEFKAAYIPGDQCCTGGGLLLTTLEDQRKSDDELMMLARAKLERIGASDRASEIVIGTWRQ